MSEELVRVSDADRERVNAFVLFGGTAVKVRKSE